MKKVLAVSSWLMAVVTLLGACRLNPNLQGEGAPALQGVWEQAASRRGGHVLTSTNYSFTFTCDSVYAVMQTTAKVKQYPGDCFNKGTWTEYARGTYALRHDSLFISATFTHKNHRQKLTGCYRIGQYLPIFTIKRRNDSLCLKNIAEDVPLVFTLKQKIVCRPKPL